MKLISLISRVFFGLAGLFKIFWPVCTLSSMIKNSARGEKHPKNESNNKMKTWRSIRSTCFFPNFVVLTFLSHLEKNVIINIVNFVFVKLNC